MILTRDRGGVRHVQRAAVAERRRGWSIVASLSWPYRDVSSIRISTPSRSKVQSPLPTQPPRTALAAPTPFHECSPLTTVRQRRTSDGRQTTNDQTEDSRTSKFDTTPSGLKTKRPHAEHSVLQPPYDRGRTSAARDHARPLRRHRQAAPASAHKPHLAASTHPPLVRSGHNARALRLRCGRGRRGRRRPSGSTHLFLRL